MKILATLLFKIHVSPGHTQSVSSSQMGIFRRQKTSGGAFSRRFCNLSLVARSWSRCSRICLVISSWSSRSRSLDVSVPLVGDGGGVEGSVLATAFWARVEVFEVVVVVVCGCWGWRLCLGHPRLLWVAFQCLWCNTKNSELEGFLTMTFLERVQVVIVVVVGEARLLVTAFWCLGQTRGVIWQK